MSTKNTLKKHEKNLAGLEVSVRNQTKRKRIETAVLGSIALTGFLVAAAMAPNVVVVLQKALPDLRPINQKQSVKKAIGRLIRGGYIEKKNNRYYISLKGEEHLKLLVLRAGNQASSSYSRKKWDKKWRIVIFDIPEKEKVKRNALRSLLIQTGFVKMQNSVWVYPFKCDEVVALLKFNLKLGRNAVYIIADGIEGDEWLREHFNLLHSR